MRQLILIKHSMVDTDLQVPAKEWRLSEEGRRRCAALAALVAEHGPEVIYCSTESKARETAKIIARQLQIACYAVDDLREHERTTVPLMGEEAFRQAMHEVFARPTERVLGEESAREALQRFARAIDGILAEHPAQNVAVVTHGTVLSLYIGDRCGWDAFQLWGRLGWPAIVTVALPEWRVVRVVEQVTE